MWLAFEDLKNKLNNEGLFSNKNKKSITMYPRNIAIITSSKGAVLQDIIKILNRRAPHLHCTIYPVSVQGKLAANEIIDAIRSCNSKDNLDTIIIARGGGSFEDLMCFNDEDLIRSIYNSQIPIISAIGHETDYTLCDYVADLRASTPSVAAEIVSEDKNETIQMLDNYQDILNKLIYHKIEIINNKIESYKRRHGLFVPEIIIQNFQNKLKAMNEKFINNVLYFINNKRNTLILLNKQVDLLNPKLQLKRGFSITTNNKDEIIKSKSDIKINDKICVHVSNGKFSAKVINTRNNND